MTRDIAGAAPGLQARTSKRQLWSLYTKQKNQCVPGIACDKDAVVNRISGTVRLNVPCRNGAKALGFSNRFTRVV
jgi:hypothetical protein